jgi:Ca-activated chloride channel family protein
MTGWFQSVQYHPLLANPSALGLLWLFPVLWVVSIFSRRQQKRNLARLGSRSALLALTTVRRLRRFVRSTCLLLGLTLLTIGAAGPQWGEDPEREFAVGRDVVVVVDVSRSMLADDVLPDRLGRARQALADLVATTERLGGHRLGLVAFAGQARVLCPLTPDFDHFREAALQLDPNDPRFAAKPTDVGVVSGTRIGLGIAAAVGLHDVRYRAHQEIILLSDGDDPANDDEWAKGAALAKQHGIPVHVFGIGDPERDWTVPGRDGKPLTRDGKPVLTRLREHPLQEISKTTHGVYTSAKTDQIPLGWFFRRVIHPLPGRSMDEDMGTALIPRYAWFYSLALAFLAMATVIADRPPPIVERPRNKPAALATRVSSAPTEPRRWVADRTPPEHRRRPARRSRALSAAS